MYCKRFFPDSLCVSSFVFFFSSLIFAVVDRALDTCLNLNREIATEKHLIQVESLKCNRCFYFKVS